MGIGIFWCSPSNCYVQIKFEYWGKYLACIISRYLPENSTKQVLLLPFLHRKLREAQLINSGVCIGTQTWWLITFAFAFLFGSPKKWPSFALAELILLQGWEETGDDAPLLLLMPHVLKAGPASAIPESQKYRPPLLFKCYPFTGYLNSGLRVFIECLIFKS